MIAAEGKAAELAQRPFHWRIWTGFLTQKVFLDLTLVADKIDVAEMNRVVGFESLNAMGDLSRFVGSRSPIANQAQGRSISNRKNASALAGRSVIAEGVFLPEP